MATTEGQDLLITLNIGQLQDLVKQAVLEAIQPLQDRINALEAIEEHDYRANSQDIRELFDAIDEIDHRQRKESQPLQRDRGEILRALIAANGGKMLAKEARQKMHLSSTRFSLLVGSMKDYVEVKSYHLRKNQNILILK